ncbi:MAG TPA: transcription elongation factor GreA, partial [Spirochaetia bacterium]|nr:transcription elongation factor GreA [Spirochaetia bacterium]
SELIISSYLLVQKIVAIHPYLNPGFDIDFKSLFDQIEDVPAVFAKIEDNELRKEFLTNVKGFVENWPDIFSELFRFSLSKFIIDELYAAGRLDVLETIFNNSLAHYREYRESFVWLVRNIHDEPWFTKFHIPFEKILICMIHLLDITYREIENRRDVSLNRRMNRQIQDFLFKEEKLPEFLMTTDEDSINRLYTLIDDVRELDPSIKIGIKHKIKDRFPNFKFMGETAMETVSRGLLVTRQGYVSKQKALRHILEVEIPENSKDIGVALEKGDLRENAEYKAALEKQDLLNNTAAKLQTELQEAQIFDANQVDTERISFGTKVELQNLKNSEMEEYTILGPWESDPSKRIISYLSPLGTHLCNHNKGEELDFTINSQNFKYRVDKIEAAQSHLK